MIFRYGTIVPKSYYIKAPWPQAPTTHIEECGASFFENANEIDGIFVDIGRTVPYYIQSFLCVYIEPTSTIHFDWATGNNKKLFRIIMHGSDFFTECATRHTAHMCRLQMINDTCGINRRKLYLFTYGRWDWNMEIVESVVEWRWLQFSYESVYNPLSSLGPKNTEYNTREKKFK